jgi:hypothetical protein
MILFYFIIVQVCLQMTAAYSSPKSNTASGPQVILMRTRKYETTPSCLPLHLLHWDTGVTSHLSREGACPQALLDGNLILTTW